VTDVPSIRVTVVHAWPDRQDSVTVELPAGTTAMAAVRASRLIAGSDVVELNLGRFGQVIAPDQTVDDGDRIEILRPLKHDPKALRRHLAGRGLSLGKKRS
jgi:putative ubiquitin-RnfH superfamily antitoxin RatB of RatAB toxin-antitoxin module